MDHRVIARLWRIVFQELCKASEIRRVVHFLDLRWGWRLHINRGIDRAFWRTIVALAPRRKWCELIALLDFVDVIVVSFPVGLRAAPDAHEAGGAPDNFEIGRSPSLPVRLHEQKISGRISPGGARSRHGEDISPQTQ